MFLKKKAIWIQNIFDAREKVFFIDENLIESKQLEGFRNISQSFWQWRYFAGEFHNVEKSSGVERGKTENW